MEAKNEREMRALKDKTKERMEKEQTPAGERVRQNEKRETDEAGESRETANRE